MPTSGRNSLIASCLCVGFPSTKQRSPFVPLRGLFIKPVQFTQMKKHNRTKTKEQSPCKDAPPRSFIYTHPLKLALLKFPCGLCGVDRQSVAAAAVMSPSWNVESFTSPKEPSRLSLPGIRQQERDAGQGLSPRRCLWDCQETVGHTPDQLVTGGVGKILLQTTPPSVLVFVKCAGKRSSRLTFTLT